MKSLMNAGTRAVCAGLVVLAAITTAQAQSPSLDAALYRSVAERVPTPLVFSTRDTVFALSLPTDEPAAVYVRLTVGKNGKVKEKQTRVHANHVAGYVAPAFLAATKDLKVDRALLVGINGKDTSLILTFPLEYQCVYDTINKELLDMTPIPWRISNLLAPRAYWHGENNEGAIQKMIREGTIKTSYSKYSVTKPTRVWYYLVFIKE